MMPQKDNFFMFYAYLHYNWDRLSNNLWNNHQIGFVWTKNCLWIFALRFYNYRLFVISIRILMIFFILFSPNQQQTITNWWSFFQREVVGICVAKYPCPQPSWSFLGGIRDVTESELAESQLTESNLPNGWTR